MNHERQLAQTLIAIGIGIMLASGNLGWLRLAVIAVAILAVYVWKGRYDLLITGTVLVALSMWRLLAGFGTLLISLAVGALVIGRLEPDKSGWTKAGVLAFGGTALLWIIVQLGLLTSWLFAVFLIGVGVYMWVIERQSGQWVTLDTLRGVVPTGNSPTPTSKTPDPAPVATPAPQTTTSPSTTVQAETPQAEVASDSTDDQAATFNQAEAAGGLLEQLLAWREQAAAQFERAPGQILRDDILEEIAEAKPQTLDALGDIRGVGVKKLERYGADILTIIKANS
ncbi:MAG: HRDC domain-containing protein [Deinococcota bacterium]